MRTIGWEYTRCIAVGSYVLIEDVITSAKVMALTALQLLGTE
jgi:hypothetical protein